MRYLTVAEIITINEEIVGEQSRLRDRHLLESAVARPLASAFGEDAYPTIYEKAAALMHSLILNHPFMDGNKRTATVAVVLFLKENGLRVTWTVEHAFKFIIEIAEGKHDVHEITDWLKNNTEQTDL
jgi:death-on-curing protein